MAVKPGAVHCIYFLRDPRNMQVRYIGMSSDPKKRFLQHCGSPHAPIRPLVTELRACGLKLILDVVLAGLEHEQASCVEKRLIYMHSQMRPGKLFGSGGYLTRKKFQVSITVGSLSKTSTPVVCDFCLTSKTHIEFINRRAVGRKIVVDGWTIIDGHWHCCPSDSCINLLDGKDLASIALQNRKVWFGNKASDLVLAEAAS